MGRVDLQPHELVELSNEDKLQQLDYNAMGRTIFTDNPRRAVQPCGGDNPVCESDRLQRHRGDGPDSWAGVWVVKKSLRA